MNNTTNKNTITLLELQTMIKRGLTSLFSENYRVVAVINDIKENMSGHCYIELVEHNDDSTIPKAKASATIWSYTYRMLKPYFESETGTMLSAGMKILITVQIQYHELYGLSLNIIDIDPTYTIGEIQLQRQKTINKLIDDGIFDMNKSLPIPALPLRIAVISSISAAGYRDFINQLYGIKPNYNFQTRLFSATLQGKDAEVSIIAAIDEIYNDIENYDIVVIIRGGGSISDLACFDSYNLASCVAQIPIPVVTGIGHDKDVSVVDLVAHTMQKTPTAAAEFLIDCAAEQDGYINEIAEKIIDLTRMKLQNTKHELHNLAVQLKNSTAIKIEYNKILVRNFFSQQMKPLLASRFREMKKLLDSYQTQIELNSPQRILQRGYSIVRHKGQTITSAAQLKPNDEIEITLYKGKTVAVMKKHS